MPTPKLSRARGSSWRDNRNQTGDSWWNESGSSKSKRRASGGSARWDPGDDEELERLKQEGAVNARRWRGECVRRASDSIRRQR